MNPQQLTIDQMLDPLKPGAVLLIKLGSIAVHADEATSGNGHQLDVEAIRALCAEPDVQRWIRDMGVYLPVKRSS